MASITTIQGTDKPSDSRIDINQNFTNLNADKIETNDAKTLTNKTIDADNNTLSNIETDNLKNTAKTGNSTKLVTGTAGATGNIAEWDAQGNAVDSTLPTSEIVRNVGNETIAGVKTFSSSPKVPSASVSNDAVNKGDLDTAISSVGGVDSLIIAQIGLGTQEFPIFTDDLEIKVGANNLGTLWIETPTEHREITKSSFGGGNADARTGLGTYNGDVYIAVQDNVPAPDEVRLYKIENVKSDLAGATITQIDGTTNSVLVASNTYTAPMNFTIDASGTFYFTYGGGSSSSRNVIRKSTISGNVLQAPTDVTCTGTITSPTSFCVLNNGDIIFSNSSQYERFNSSGASQKHITNYFPTSFSYFFNYSDGINDYVYVYKTNEGTSTPAIIKNIY